MIHHYLAARAELDAPGSPFATHMTTIRGVPAKSYVAAPPTMRAIWETTVAHADKDYLVYEDERYTYAEIHAQVRKLAAYLVANGVTPGSRVAIAMRNYPEWVVGYWAGVSVGAAVVGMNAWWTPPEMEYALNDSEPRVLIADDERLERLLQMPSQRPMHIIAVRTDRAIPGEGATWASVMASADPGSLPAVSIDPDDDATIFYTSGTTGFPKGAQLTNRGSVHNILNIAAMTTAVAMSEQKAIAAGDVPPPPPAPPALPASFMAPTPLFHVTACNCILHPATLTGGKVVLMYKWDPGRALELIEREKVTNFSGVPTMSREMLMHPDWSKRDTSSLAGLGGGGAALQPDLVHKIAGALKNGQPSTGYGMTETHGIITANSSRWFVAKPESCGPAVPTLETKLVDEEGRDLPAGPNTVGVLCVRGSVTIKGYLNRPEATADTIKDGWLNTGDIARIDEDGFIYIVDRAKDMVIRGGENVYCSEVETAIYHHDAIAEACVFGIPEERLGEEVAAVLVLRPGASLTEDELRQFLAASLAKHKIPTKIWFRNEPIPRNANGKFLKRELKKELTGS
ncbi:MAG: AMP-dependent synthetase [Actinobacteria bacterium]|nr:AMP-dependent synthetase [Actinomycetota bacterium]NDA78448.1 AMP-dependent synthetase [Actinomycetota bacterium]